MIMMVDSQEDKRIWDLIGSRSFEDVASSYKCHFCPSESAWMSAFIDYYDVSEPDSNGDRWLKCKFDSPARYAFTCEACKDKTETESYKSKCKGGF